MTFLRMLFVGFFVAGWAMQLMGEYEKAIFYILVSIICLLGMIESHLDRKE